LPGLGRQQFKQNLELPQPAETTWQMHLPGYNYLGPGTHIYENMQKHVQPTNEADARAMLHDLAYISNNDHEKADNDFLHNEDFNPSWGGAIGNTGIRLNKFLRQFGLDFSQNTNNK
jgi:hypothetical protein